MVGRLVLDYFEGVHLFLLWKIRVHRQLLPAKGNYMGNYFPLKAIIWAITSR